MRRAYARTMLAVTAALAAAPAEAQDPVSRLREMSLSDMLEVDISTGTSKFIKQAPVVAYVITADDIARMGARNLLEVLESVPGINPHLFQSGPNSPIVDMRGSFTQRSGSVLFLRDGKPLRLVSNLTMPEIFRLPVQFIDRIEIARGPASAIYGADALGGAVNIITRRDPALAGLRAGSPLHRGEWVGNHGKWKELEWSLAAQEMRHVDDAVTRNSQNRTVYAQEFRHEYGDVDAKLKWAGLTASFWGLNYYKSEYGAPNNPRGVTHVFTHHRHFDLGYGIDLTPTTKLTAQAFHARFQSLRLGEVRGGVPLDDRPGEVRTSTDVSLTESRFAHHRLRLSAGGFRERRYALAVNPPPPPGAPPAPPAITSWRNTYYVAAQDEFAFAPDWELTAGLRSDHYDDIGTVSNPRLGLVWNVNRQLTAKLLAGEAFRAPAYGEAALVGNRPERMKNVEAAVDYRPDERWSVLASVYRYRVKDLLDGPAGTPLIERDGRGTEIAATWLATQRLRLEVSAAFVDVENHATGARLPLSPRRIAKAAVNWQATDRWSVNARWEGYWDRVRAPANDPRPPVEDLNVAHVATHYAMTPRLTLTALVHNAFNQRAYVPVQGGGNAFDFQLLERSYSFQAEYRF